MHLNKCPQAPQLHAIRATSIAGNYKLIALITHICSTCEHLLGIDFETFCPNGRELAQNYKVFLKNADSIFKGFSSMRASFRSGIFKIKIKNRCVPVLITVLWKKLVRIDNFETNSYSTRQ